MRAEQNLKSNNFLWLTWFERWRPVGISISCLYISAWGTICDNHLDTYQRWQITKAGCTGRILSQFRPSFHSFTLDPMSRGNDFLTGYECLNLHLIKCLHGDDHRHNQRCVVGARALPNLVPTLEFPWTSGRGGAAAPLWYHVIYITGLCFTIWCDEKETKMSFTRAHYCSTKADTNFF